MKGRIALGLILALAASTSSAQSLKDSQVAMTRGDWKVLRSVDQMTDKTSCTGIYKENYGIQLSSENLFIKIDGGIQSATLRFDENPPSRLRLATELEKKLRALTISGSDFNQLRTARRLRYQSGTLVSGIQSGEIDLTDFAPVLDSIQQGCPSSQSEISPPAQKKNDSCSTELIKKMKAQGLSPEQILAICE